MQGGVQPQRAGHQSRAVNVSGSAATNDQAQPSVSGSDRLVPPSSDLRSSDNRQQATRVHEAYDLETFLKERDACGVRLLS